MHPQKNLRLGRLLFLGFLLASAHSIAGADTCVDRDHVPAIGESVTIKAVGDIVIGSDWPTSVYPPGFNLDLENRLKRVIGPADAVFGNFEGALTTHSVSTKAPNFSTVFAFRMPPSFAQMLKSAGFNVMHIANNHTFDFGQIGYNDTITHLTKAGIATVGETDKVTIQKSNGVTIAWIGFSHLYRYNHVGNLAKLAQLIQQARPVADLVVVSLQAGAEGSEALKVTNYDEKFLGENRGNTYAFAHRAIDLGADLVLGHGPHVVRGLECYKGKLIAYSLGNFIGYNALSIKRAAALSMVLEVKLSKDRRTLGYNVIPVRFNEERLPEIDNSNLVHYLLNDLSRLTPLNGSVTLPVSREGEAAYRQWLQAADLVKILKQ